MEQKGRRAHILCGIGAAVLAALFFVSAAGTRRELRDLRNEVAGVKNDVYDRVSALESSLSRQIGGLGHRLDEGASLFSGVKTGLGYADKRMTLTVTATPKTLSEGDAILLLLGGETFPLMPQPGGAAFAVTAKFLPCEELTPTLAQVSGGVRRMETLDTLYPGEMLTLNCNSDWLEGNQLQITIDATEHFDVATLNGGNYTIRVEDGQGNAVSTLPLTMQNSNASVYCTADLSQYTGSDVKGQRVFTLTAQMGGLNFEGIDALATYEQQEIGGSYISAGGTVLVAQWES